MSDLISRQAAIDALDVLCQEHRYKIPGKAETYSQYNEAWQDALDRAEGAIGDLPSANPEIVACGDCIHWVCHDRRCGYWNHGVKNDRLISLNAAIETVRKAKNLYQAHKMLIQLPSVDAVPVVHGRWIFGKDDETGERDVYAWACSLCGEKYPWRPHYCPNCGADMRDGKDEA